MRKHICILSMFLLPFTVYGQQSKFSKAFDRLDLSVSAGSTGIGFELSTPIHKDIKLRAGYSFMPKFSKVMTFDVEGRRPNGEITSFDKMANLYQELFGIEADGKVDMVGKPTFNNFNILVDFHPFKRKNWHLTTGLYLGAKEIGHAYNKTEEMPSLLVVSMYNNMYDKILDDQPLYDDIYLDPEIGEKILNYGRMGIYVGEFKNGETYMMEPDKNSMVKVRMKTKTCVRPYVGFGYGGRLVKGNDKCYVSFDCGAMYWGGVPEVLTHDGVDLTRDLSKIRGQVDDYVRLAKKFPVYPVLNFKISYKIF